jgi:hypothetical protein
MITTKNKFGLLHSYDDKPSLIDNGDLYWHKNGKLHGDNDLPSIIMNNGDKYWFHDGVPFRSDDGPHEIIKTGRSFKEVHNWINQNKEIYKSISTNKSDRKVQTTYISLNNLPFDKYPLRSSMHIKEESKKSPFIIEKYLLMHKEHREDGPALIVYHKNKDFFMDEQYKIKGVFFRNDGPAHVQKNKKGEITRESYHFRIEDNNINISASYSYEWNEERTSYLEYFRINKIKVSKETFIKKIENQTLKVPFITFISDLKTNENHL